MEAYREEKRELKRCIYQSIKKVNEQQFGRKMNEDGKGGKVEICSRIKDESEGFGRIF